MVALVSYVLPSDANLHRFLYVIDEISERPITTATVLLWVPTLVL